MENSAHQTLGCDCDSPSPKSPGSALCAQCGLIYLTAEQYGEHLARCRTEVATLLDPKPEAEAPEPEPEAIEVELEAEPDEDPPSGSRRWFKRRRNGMAAPAA